MEESFFKQSIADIIEKTKDKEFSGPESVEFITNLLKEHSECEAFQVLSKINVSKLSLEVFEQIITMFKSPFFQSASNLIKSEHSSYEDVKRDNAKLSEIVLKMEDPATSLFNAVKEGVYDLAKAAIEKDKTIINTVDETNNNYTPLIIACEVGNPKVVKLLIESGADIEAKGNYEMRALHRACANGHTSICSMLIEAGADIEAPDEDGERSIHYSLLNNSSDIVQLLIDHGCDFNVKNNYKQTPLKKARVKKAFDCIKILENYKAIE